MRLTASGANDPTFGSNGIVRINGAPTSSAFVGLALERDGRIIAASNDATTAPAARGYVLRLNADGTPDTTFGTGGLAFIDLTAEGDQINAMALHADGGIVLAGHINGPYAAHLSLHGRPAIIKLLGTPREIQPAALPVAGANRPYSAQLAASGGKPPYSYALSSGTLPAGLTLSAAGLLSGTPTTPGSFSFTIQSTDSASGSLTRSYTVLVHSSATLTASYYQTILGRPVDPSGERYWADEIARLSSLGASVNEAFYSMAAAFFASPEYVSRNTTDVQFLADVYRTFFNRDSDPSGIAYWSGELAAGKPRGAVLNDFMYSPEFADFMTRIFGPAASSRAEVSMVMDFYRGLLGRLPDTEGFVYWRDRFRAAQCNGIVASEADTMSSLFIYSAEYGARQGALAPAQRAAGFVIDHYNAFLKRGGDRAGFLYWVDQINSGARTGEQVRGAFRDSPEFQSRVQAVLAQGCSL